MTLTRCGSCGAHDVAYHPPRTRVTLCRRCYRRIYYGYDPPRCTEPSSDEVERLVAIGYAALPPWWGDEREEDAR